MTLTSMAPSPFPSKRILRSYIKHIFTIRTLLILSDNLQSLLQKYYVSLYSDKGQLHENYFGHHQ